MLWEFTNKNKHGNLRTRIIYRPDGEAFSIRPKGLGNFIAVKRFRYMSKSPFPPGLYTSSVDGKKYMLPDWKEVHPQTTLNDIKPFEEETRGRKKQDKKINNPKEWKFESKSDPGSFYVVTQISDYKVKCTCSGQYRAKDRKCRHMKEVMAELGIK